VVKTLFEGYAHRRERAGLHRHAGIARANVGEFLHTS